MFPNFKSLADKERKRKALLAQLANQVDDIGNEEESRSDIDDTPIVTEFRMSAKAKRELNRRLKGKSLPDDQKLPRYKIIEMLTKYPEMAMHRYNPLKTSGLPDDSVYISKDGELYTVVSNKRSRKADYVYDWGATLAYIKAMLDAKAVSPGLVNAIPAKNNESGSDIEKESFEILKDILSTNELPIQPTPYKKGNNRAKNPISLGNAYLVNTDMKIVDRTNKVLKPRNDISWASTLEQFVKQLQAQNVTFKESSMFRSSRPYIETTNTVAEFNPDMTSTGTQISDVDIRAEVLHLYNDNARLADLRVQPVAKRDSNGKATYAESSYVLGEYATIYKADGSDLTKKQSDRQDKLTDWWATLQKIRADVPNITLATKTPRALRNRRTSSLHLSDLGSTSGMSGIGVAGWT